MPFRQWSFCVEVGSRRVAFGTDSLSNWRSRDILQESHCGDLKA